MPGRSGLAIKEGELNPVAAPAASHSTAPADTSSSGRGLGLGLGKQSSAPAAAAKPTAALGLGLHKPSSRATTAINVLSSSDVDEKDPSSSSSSSSATSSLSQSGEGYGKPLMPSTAGGSNPPNLKNKLLTRATAGTSREFPSPKLGPRSLGAGPVPILTSAPTLPGKQRSGSGSGSAALGLGSTNASDAESPTLQPGDDTDDLVTDTEADSAANAAATTEEESVDEENDLIKKPSSKDPLSRLKEEIPLPVTASPKQFNSSLKLLGLAVPIKDPNSMSPILASDGKTLLNPPTNANVDLIKQSTANLTGDTISPKPQFLRRLDSPLTHHGQVTNSHSCRPWCGLICGHARGLAASLIVVMSFVLRCAVVFPCVGSCLPTRLVSRC